MPASNVLKIADPIVPQIIQSLRQSIIDMRLKPGEALSEKEIAQRYGISRQPVREAFIKLAEAGLLQVLPSRGTYVVKISVREVLNARFVREALECAIVRSAAATIDDATIMRLRSLLTEQQDATLGQDYPRFKALDEAFHRTIAESVECDLAVRVVEGARAQTDRVRYLSLPEATSLDVLILQHQMILQALIARDPEAAEAAMRHHLREILSALPRLKEQYPELFDDSATPAHAWLIG